MILSFVIVTFMIALFMIVLHSTGKFLFVSYIIIYNLFWNNDLSVDRFIFFCGKAFKIVLCKCFIKSLFANHVPSPFSDFLRNFIIIALEVKDNYINLQFINILCYPFYYESPGQRLTFIYDDVTAKWHIRLLWICVCSFHKYYI